MARLFSSQTPSHVIHQHFSNPFHSTHTYLTMKMEQAECSETSAYKIQTLGNYPKESVQHLEYGESLKLKIKHEFPSYPACRLVTISTELFLISPRRILIFHLNLQQIKSSFCTEQFSYPHLISVTSQHFLLNHANIFRYSP
jgi:hypothetical protein